jgi:CPA2 family monovalent cation:H+ antiporter-2
MHESGLIITLVIGLSAALLLGIFTQRLGLSPIVGYLLAGIAVGPYTPGIFADINISKQLAEVGVILLLFGVGLQFHFDDLLAVKTIAIPGAVVQSIIATALGVMAAMYLGWGFYAGLVMGMSVSVASTVVLVRMLMDNQVLNAVQGRIAVGWLVVEDIFTIFLLILLPALALALKGTGLSPADMLISFSLAIVKIALFGMLMLVVGARTIPWLLLHVARLKSRELFTLSVLAIALAVALGASLLFGASIELGAFLAGMVVGQSKVSHQAAADALPMRDAFAVLFFVSVGMLFNPMFVIEKPFLVLQILFIIIVCKPLAAIFIVALFGYSFRTMLTVAIGLAQIGEFSFILAQLGQSLEILPQDAYSALIACALLSIALNPLLFRSIDPIETWFKRNKRLWKLVNRRAEKHALAVTSRLPPLKPSAASLQALVVGYGPVGQTVTRILRKFGIEPVIVELNVDVVTRLIESGIRAVYGDACQPEILETAGLKESRYLIITLPDLTSRIPVIVNARIANPDLKILVRARYLAERAMLEELGTTSVCYEEAEAAVALAELLLVEVGADESQIQKEAVSIREEWALRKDMFAL